MASRPLADRLVEVIAELGESVKVGQYRYGSGCIVYGRTVLTAAHVVLGAKSIRVRYPDKRMRPASLDHRFVGQVDGPGPDLALLEIDDPALDLPPLELARADRDNPLTEPVERCHAIGYPWFAQAGSPSEIRDSIDAIGVVPMLSKLATGLLSLQVSISPRPLPAKDVALGKSEWTGISGGPVMAAGMLLGVVVEHAAREGQSTITAVPLTALEQNPTHLAWGKGVKNPTEWWSRLGVRGISDLRWLPPRVPPRPQPAYQETLREFGRTLHHRMPQLVGRDRELADIAAFATGPGGYRWVVAPMFSGKTALLFEAVTVGLPDDVDVVSYFLTRRASDADSSRFLTAVVPQLAYLCELDPPVADRDQFNMLWRKATERAAELGRSLLLVVDGLDEDLRPFGSPSVASLLPAHVNGVAHVLVASRPHPKKPPVDVPDRHTLRLRTIRRELTRFEGAKKLVRLAEHEVYALTHGPDVDLAVEAFGFLTAAAGPLSVNDMAILSSDLAAPSSAHVRHLRRLITEDAARSLEPVGPLEHERYRFAHDALRKYARKTADLGDVEFLQRIHRWAEHWRDGGWPTTTDFATSTPQYLLDSYPGRLAQDPERLAALLSDVGWIDAAIQGVGVDRVLADLHKAAAQTEDTRVRKMLAVVEGEAHDLRSPSPITKPGYVLRQLWLYATELNERELADELRSRLRDLPNVRLMPHWTSRPASRALRGAFGRTNDVFDAVVLPGGRLVTGGRTGRVLAWDPDAPGTGPTLLGSQDSQVSVMRVLPGGRVVTGGEDGRVLVWDPDTPGIGPSMLGSHIGWVTAAVALPGGRVVTGGEDGRVLVWDPDAPGTGPSMLASHVVWGRAAVALPGGRVVTGGQDGRVLVWDPDAPGAGPSILGSHSGWVSAVVALPAGRVVTGGQDGRVLVWDPDAPGSSPVLLGSHHGAVEALAVLPDGRVLSGEWGVGSLLVSDPNVHDTPSTVVGKHFQLTALAVLPDGRVITGGEDGKLLVWDLDDADAGPMLLGSHDGRVGGVLVLPNGWVVTGGSDQRLLLWDTDAKASGLTRPGNNETDVGEVAVLPGGRVVTGGQDGRVLLWNLEAAETGPAVLGSHDRKVARVAVLPDGRVVSAGGEGRVLLWDPDAPETGPTVLGDHPRWMTAMAVMPDGRVVTGWSGGPVLIWDPNAPQTGPTVLDSQQEYLSTVAILPGGRVITAESVVGGGSDGRLEVWNPDSPGTGPTVLGDHDGGAKALAVMPDGKVVTAEDDGRVLVWNPDAWETGPTLVGTNGSRVREVAVLPDGRVVTGGEDGRVLVWNPDTPGTPPRLLGSHEGFVTALAVLPGALVVTGGIDRRLLVSDATTFAEIAQLSCSVDQLVIPSFDADESFMVIDHGAGLSLWSIV